MNFCSSDTPANEPSRLFLRMIRDKCAGAILAAMRSVLSGFRLIFMLRFDDARRVAAGLLLLTCAAFLGGQTLAARTPVIFTVVDENGQAVAGAQVTITEAGLGPAQLWTDYAGSCRYALRPEKPYRVHVEKAGFYAADEGAVDPGLNDVKVTLAHEQMVREAGERDGVDCRASIPSRCRTRGR